MLPVLEKGGVSARALHSSGHVTSGRWHIHCAIELPAHFDAVALKLLIRDCWAKVEWGYGQILVRDGANAGWISYMLKATQKSEFDVFLDCVLIEFVAQSNCRRVDVLWIPNFSYKAYKGRLVSIAFISFSYPRARDRSVFAVDPIGEAGGE